MTASIPFAVIASVAKHLSPPEVISFNHTLSPKPSAANTPKFMYRLTTQDDLDMPESVRVVFCAIVSVFECFVRKTQEELGTLTVFHGF